MDLPERYVEFGRQIGGRDAKAIRKTVSGLVKLIHPDGKVEKGEVLEYVEFAMEQRRRVKEQLKKMGGLEYCDVDFSYRDLETRCRDVRRSCPRVGGGLLITGQPLPAGSVYTLGTDLSEPGASKLALFLIQTQVNPGVGRVIPLGNLSTTMKDALKVADAYLKANLKDLGYRPRPQAVRLQRAGRRTSTRRRRVPRRRSGSSSRSCPRCWSARLTRPRSSSAR